MGQIISGIDIGTSKVATVIGLLNEDNEIEVLGKGIELCYGVKKGTIIDIEAVYAAICSSVKQAETTANVKLNSAFINIPSAQAEFVSNRAGIEIVDKSAGIRKQDVSKVLEASRKVEVIEDNQIIDVVPLQYFVDDYEGIKEPVGMKGSKLGVEVDIVFGKAAAVDNLIRTVEMSALKIDGIIVDLIASSEVVLTADEKALGTILIDVGGTVTNILIFIGKELVFNSVVNLGGENITKDLSIGLKIPLNEAEKIKREYAFCIESIFDSTETVSVYDVSGEKKEVEISHIAEIIDARAREIVKLSFEAFRNSGIKRNQISGVVMTGAGISYIDGCSEYAKQLFEMPLRIPSYKGMEGVKPEFITGLGMLRYAANHARFSSSSEIKITKENEPERKSGIIGRLKGIFGSN